MSSSLIIFERSWMSSFSGRTPKVERWRRHFRRICDCDIAAGRLFFFLIWCSIRVSTNWVYIILFFYFSRNEFTGVVSFGSAFEIHPLLCIPGNDFAISFYCDLVPSDLKRARVMWRFGFRCTLFRENLIGDLYQVWLLHIWFVVFRDFLFLLLSLLPFQLPPLQASWISFL